mmetsp:Transcript_24982/g.61582  ORF Transcript_24982/g.61582 Transcript_24982/m.61582 type:complete len:370 (-) Transcript_24982:474-1583(-)
MQDNNEDGIFVYLPADKRGDLFSGAGFMPIYAGAPSGLTVGKNVTVTGTVKEYYNMLQIDSPISVVVVGDAPMPTPNVRKSGDLNGTMRCDNATEAIEHTLVTVKNLKITTAEDKYNHFFADDGSGPVLIGNGLYRLLNPAFASVGDTITSLTGVLSYEFGYYEINPRDKGDIGPISYLSGSAPVLSHPVLTITQATSHNAAAATTPGCSGYAAAYEGQIVTVSGVVTGLDKQPIRVNNVVTGYDIVGYYLQDGAKLYGGIRVYLLSYERTPMKTGAGHMPEVGMQISVSGMIAEYFNATQMKDVVASSIINIKAVIPEPLMLTTGVFAGAKDKCDISNEPYEGMLVTFKNVNVTIGPNKYGEFYVDDG